LKDLPADGVSVELGAAQECIAQLRICFMDRETKPIDRTPKELARFAVGVAGLWMAGAGIVLWNYWLAGACAAVMVVIISLFIRDEK
jgi:hypothetical protein